MIESVLGMLLIMRGWLTAITLHVASAPLKLAASARISLEKSKLSILDFLPQSLISNLFLKCLRISRLWF
jgi:hypothetical protein